MTPSASSGMPSANISLSRALDGLRTATGSLHARLDTGLNIGKATASLDDYVSHLQTLRPWLAKSQAMLRAIGAPGLGGAADRIEERLAYIDADLADAGDSSLVGVMGDSDASAQNSEIGPVSAAYGWGRAYVVEGSGLGGRVLFRRLRERLAPHPLRYLAGDAAATPGQRWADFAVKLDQHIQTPAHFLEAQRGAIGAFSELLDSFALNETGTRD